MPKTSKAKPTITAPTVTKNEMDENLRIIGLVGKQGVVQNTPEPFYSSLGNNDRTKIYNQDAKLKNDIFDEPTIPLQVNAVDEKKIVLLKTPHQNTPEPITEYLKNEGRDDSQLRWEVNKTIYTNEALKKGNYAQAQYLYEGDARRRNYINEYFGSEGGPLTFNASNNPNLLSQLANQRNQAGGPAGAPPAGPGRRDDYDDYEDWMNGPDYVPHPPGPPGPPGPPAPPAGDPYDDYMGLDDAPEVGGNFDDDYYENLPPLPASPAGGSHEKKQGKSEEAAVDINKLKKPQLQAYLSGLNKEILNYDNWPNNLKDTVTKETLKNLIRSINNDPNPLNIGIDLTHVSLPTKKSKETEKLVLQYALQAGLFRKRKSNDSADYLNKLVGQNWYHILRILTILRNHQDTKGLPGAAVAAGHGLKKRRGAKKYEKVVIEGVGLKPDSQKIAKDGKRVDKRVYKSFGNFLIDMKKLLDDNQLYVVYSKNYHFVDDIPRTQISNDLKAVILALLQGTAPSFDGLKPKELEFMNYLVKRSKSNIQMPKVITGGSAHAKGPCICSFGNGKTKLKNRLDILSGEIMAGNDSPQVLNELSQIINQMQEKGYINQATAKKYQKAFIDV
jgi:hypothetical protein